MVMTFFKIETDKNGASRPKSIVNERMKTYWSSSSGLLKAECVFEQSTYPLFKKQTFVN